MPRMGRKKQKEPKRVTAKPVTVDGDTAFLRLRLAVHAPTHANRFCAACSRPITGVLASCVTCGVNLCSGCMEAGATGNAMHDPALHPMLLLRRNNEEFWPQGAAQAVPPLYRPKDAARLKRLGDAHVGTACGRCKVSPIVGTRYRCGHCANFDLCSSCWTGATYDSHAVNHVFLLVPRPVLFASRVPMGAFLKQLCPLSGTGDALTWGYKLTVTPRFSGEYQSSLLRRKQAGLDSAVATQSSWALPADQQLAELVSRICDKMSGGVDATTATAVSRSQRTDNAQVQSPLKLSPRDLVSSPAEIVRYRQLEGRSVEELRLRFAVLRLLNARVAPLLPLIDWTRTGDDRSLAHVFRDLRGVVFSQLKMGLWDRAIKATDAAAAGNQQHFGFGGHRGGQAISVDRRSALFGGPGAAGGDHGDEDDDGDEGASDDEGNGGDAADGGSGSGGHGGVNINESSIFAQMATQLLAMAPAKLRKNQQPFNVTFKGEQGVDAGGLFRDLLSEMCAELQSDRLPLFLPCPNAQNKVGFTLDKWVPHPGCTRGDHLALYTVLGRIMGVAVRLKEPLQLDLPTMVWKPLVGMPVDEGDLEAVDEVFVKTMRMLKDEAELAKNMVTEDTFEDAIDAYWVVRLSNGREVPLREGGAERQVSWADRVEYANQCLQHRLREMDAQVAALRSGLVSVVPGRLLNLLTPAELESLVCGSTEVDLDLLKKHTRYSRCRPNDRHIRLFWKVLEDFTQEERSLFLRFAWGRSRLPIASNFTDAFTISAFEARGNTDDPLPVSHTCFFSVDLPEYSCYAVMRDKLLKAITMCTSTEIA